MPVNYKGFPLIPAPMVGHSKTYNRNAAGEIIGVDHSFTLDGTIVNIGNLNIHSRETPGYTYTEAVLGAQEYLRLIFNSEPGLLEISGPLGSGNKISAYAETVSLNVEPGTWVNRADYTVELSAKGIFDEGVIGSRLTSTNDEWSYQENPDGTVALTHTVSANGYLIFDNSGNPNTPLSDIIEWVQDRLVSINNGNASGVVEDPTI